MQISGQAEGGRVGSGWLNAIERFQAFRLLLSLEAGAPLFCKFCSWMIFTNSVLGKRQKSIKHHTD